MPFALKPPTIAIIATLGLGLSSGVSADATRPIDYTQRNQPYAPAESVTPTTQKPATNGAVQDKRVDKATVEKQPSSLLEREAPMGVNETRPKEVREKKSHRPEVVEHATSRYNHRLSSISTASDTSKPPTVAKYQDSLTSASATNMARFPAVDRATTAKINRFVFRKNPPESSVGVKTGAAIPAAGGSVLQK